MSDWVTLTDADVTARLNAPEIASLQALQGQPGPTIPALIAEEVATVRGLIKAGGNARGPAGTIPASLKTHLISSVIWQWLCSFPQNVRLQTDGRKALNTDAQTAFTAIASGKLKVELPDAGDPADTVAAPINAIQQAGGERRQFTRKKMRGL